jgi:hypothetical protein
MNTHLKSHFWWVFLTCFWYLYVQLQFLYVFLFLSLIFSGFYSNHSLRATCATRLFQCGVDEQLIAAKTGHRSLAIRSYKRPCLRQEKEVSTIIQEGHSSSVSGLYLAFFYFSKLTFFYTKHWELYICWHFPCLPL